MSVMDRSYEPFGEVLTYSGTRTSNFQFGGQQVDGTGLVFLRARYLEPAVGRFLSRDVWEGDPSQPMTNNGWLYALANPSNLADPSGYWYCVGNSGCQRWIAEALLLLHTMGDEGRELSRLFAVHDQSLMSQQRVFLSIVMSAATPIRPGLTNYEDIMRSAMCSAEGFPFVVDQSLPIDPFFVNDWDMETMPWAIYIRESFLSARPQPSYQDAALLGHELHHLLRQGFHAASVRGELDAAQVQARLLLAVNIRPSDQFDGRTALELRLGVAEDLDLYRSRTGYPNWLPRNILPYRTIPLRALLPVDLPDNPYIRHRLGWQ